MFDNHSDDRIRREIQTVADEFTPINLAKVREIIGFPSHKFIEGKKKSSIGDFLMRFIAHSTFYCMATADENGQLDVTPRGDPPGSVRVLDPWTLALPDRPGNKLADSFENIERNPSVGLVFFVPGLSEIVRVNGDAFVTDDPDLLHSLGAGGKPAVLATIVRVREAFTQCGKAVIRSQLWEGDSRLLADAVTMGADFYTLALAQDAGSMANDLGDQLGDLNEMIQDDYRDGLF